MRFRLRRLDGAGLARGVGKGVPLRRVARHGVPGVLAFIALENHGEQGAFLHVNSIAWLHQVIVRLVHNLGRGDGLLRASERTVLPHDAVRVHTAVVDDNAARAILVARGHILELHAAIRRRETRAVSLGHLRFLQEVVPVTIVIKVIEVDNVVVVLVNVVVLVIRERQLSIRVRGAGAEGLTLGLEVLVGLIELELGALHRTAILVELDNVGLGNRHEVELELHVGVGGAALQVEELEGVVGVVGEGAAVPARVAGLARLLVLAQQCAVVIVVYLNVARMKVDAQTRAVVNTADITHEDIIDEHPDVIIAGELEGHLIIIVRQAAVGLHESRGH